MVQVIKKMDCFECCKDVLYAMYDFTTIYEEVNCKFWNWLNEITFAFVRWLMCMVADHNWWLVNDL